MIRKSIALLLTLLFLAGTLCAAAEEGEFPALNDAGFLDSGEFVFEDEENGVWRYASETLRVEIFRREQKRDKKIKQLPEVWYEAEVFCAEGSTGPRMIANDPENWKIAANMEYPYKIARKYGVVLAVSNDFAQLRIQQKKGRPGIIIRDGKIIADRTKKQGVKDFPNLDCLAIWPDGDMKVYYSDELTAEEYLEAGAIDVLAFGPVLIRDGELNEKGLKQYGTSRAPRTAVGMVEKGHYWFMMLEGRINRSKGDSIRFLAEKMLDKGCTVGFNLDGGDTACIVSMGHQLCKLTDLKKHLSSRRTSDILGVGTSELLPTLNDPW